MFFIVTLSIFQPKIINIAMAAFYQVIFIKFCFICLLTNTKSTNIVVTTVWNQNLVEVTQTDRTVVFESFTSSFCVCIPAWWVICYALNFPLEILGVNPYFVSFLHFLYNVGVLNLVVNLYLLLSFWKTSSSRSRVPSLKFRFWLMSDLWEKSVMIRNE